MFGKSEATSGNVGWYKKKQKATKLLLNLDSIQDTVGTYFTVDMLECGVFSV